MIDAPQRKPLIGLAKTFKITTATYSRLYNCRFCTAEYAVRREPLSTAVLGALRRHAMDHANANTPPEVRPV